MRSMKQAGASLMAAALILTGARLSATPSDPVLVDASCQSRHWGLVFTNETCLAWDWMPSATRAELEIKGMNGSFTTNFESTASNVLWRAFLSDIPSVEDVYDLTLKLYTNGTEAAVTTMTSRLAVVTGAFGETVVNAVTDSPAWGKVKNNVVIPYNAAFSETLTNAVTAQLVIAKQGGAVQTNTFADVAGYTGWKLRNSGWGYGTFELTLTFSGTTNEWVAVLTRPIDGTIVRMR